MSRYSRTFNEQDVSPAGGRSLPAYSRYRERPQVIDKTSCRLCDGKGQYAGPEGLVDCDLCKGMGVLRDGTQHDVPLFRSRNKSGQ